MWTAVHNEEKWAKPIEIHGKKVSVPATEIRSGSDCVCSTEERGRWLLQVEGLPAEKEQCGGYGII